ncbi:MAG: DUF1801 domain-containing protein [Candidatus Hodarchaeales archaeon]|jgi:hypothetical protein
MVELKTKKNDQSVELFLNKVQDEQKREDSFQILEMLKEITQEEPKMWGNSIIGFGDYQYKYKSGHGGEWFIIGFSPRKQNLTLYVTPGFAQYENFLKDLGKYSTGKSCLYIKKLSDVNMEVLKQLAAESVKYVKESYAA